MLLLVLMASVVAEVAFEIPLPESALSHFHEAHRLILGKRSPDRAMLLLQKAVAIAPRFQEAYANLGHVMHSVGLWDQSIEMQNRAIQLDPQV